MNDIIKEENGFDGILSYEYYYSFPKEYQRRWLDSLDKRFALILLGSFIVHVFTALYFAINPPQRTISGKDIEAIQDQYVNLILEKEIANTDLNDDDLAALDFGEDESVTTGERIKRVASGTSRSGGGVSDADEAENSGEVAVQQTARKTGRSGSSRGTGAQASRDVGSQGLLGLLTSSAETSTGSEAADILSEVDAGGGDLDKALSRVDRLKVGSQGSPGGKGSGSGSATGTGSGTGSHDVKGSRSSSSEGIGGVISGRGTARSKDIDRQGGFVVSTVSEVANDEGIKSQSRNPDEVSAVINNHNSAIQYCYQREVKRNPDLKGKIVIRFTITPNGRVNEAKILSSTLGNQSVERCVLNRIRRWDDFGVIEASRGDAAFRQIYTFGY